MMTANKARSDVIVYLRAAITYAQAGDYDNAERMIHAAAGRLEAARNLSLLRGARAREQRAHSALLERLDNIGREGVLNARG